MPKGAPFRRALVAFLKNHILLQPYAVYPNIESRVGKENKGQIVFSVNQRLEEMLSLLMPIATVFLFQIRRLSAFFFYAFRQNHKKIFIVQALFFLFFPCFKK